MWNRQLEFDDGCAAFGIEAVKRINTFLENAHTTEESCAAIRLIDLPKKLGVDERPATGIIHAFNHGGLLALLLSQNWADEIAGSRPWEAQLQQLEQFSLTTLSPLAHNLVFGPLNPPDFIADMVATVVQSSLTLTQLPDSYIVAFWTKIQHNNPDFWGICFGFASRDQYFKVQQSYDRAA